MMPAHQMMNRSALSSRGDSVENAVRLRIRAEFYEMPGLKLTLAQASRLFHLEAARCQQALTSLVNTGQLVLRGDTFLRTP